MFHVFLSSVLIFIPHLQSKNLLVYSISFVHITCILYYSPNHLQHSYFLYAFLVYVVSPCCIAMSQDLKIEPLMRESKQCLSFGGLFGFLMQSGQSWNYVHTNKINRLSRLCVCVSIYVATNTHTHKYAYIKSNQTKRV